MPGFFPPIKRPSAARAPAARQSPFSAPTFERKALWKQPPAPGNHSGASDGVLAKLEVSRPGDPLERGRQQSSADDWPRACVPKAGSGPRSSGRW
jgi:hypothetical protein